MKTRDELQSCVDELRQVCARHGVVLIGNECGGYAYGEIALVDVKDIDQREKHNLLEYFDPSIKDEDAGGGMKVDYIGDLPA